MSPFRPGERERHRRNPTLFRIPCGVGWRLKQVVAFIKRFDDASEQKSDGNAKHKTLNVMSAHMWR